MRYEDFMKPLWGLLLGLTACALLAMLTGSCAARKPVVTGNGTYRADTAYVTNLVRDTFLVRDSVMVDVRRDGDTVFKTKEVWRWRERASLRVDTVYKSAVRADTIRVAVPVERRLTWWERTVERPLEKVAGAMAVIATALWLMWLVIKRIRNKTVLRTRGEE